MIVTMVTTDPYIASRHPDESTTPHQVFEGTKKECEQYLLDVYNNKMDAPYASRVCDAVRFSNKSNNIDGMSRYCLKGKHLCFSYDSRYWEITTKKQLAKDLQEKK